MIVLLIMIVIGVVVPMLVDTELRGRDPRPEDFLGVNVRIAEREAAQRALQLRERQPGIEQRADRHVAGDPRKTVEVQNPAHSSRNSFRLQ